MNLIRTEWNKNNYKFFLDYLYTLHDEEYRIFHSKLLKNKEIKNIGVTTPQLKRIAKEISKGNYLSFIKCISHKYYEEDLIYGLILGYLKEDFDIIEKLLDEFLPYNNNWATNDIVCANLKIFKKEQDKGFMLIQKYLNANNLWAVRFGIVLLLDFYINDKYIEKVLTIAKTIRHNDYYVLMALSWLLSICYIKYPDSTLQLLKQNNLNRFVQNKTIQKINDSKRISTKNKEMLIQYKK